MRNLFFSVSLLLASTVFADSLNTQWQLVRNTAATPDTLPENIAWQPVNVPGFVTGNPDIPLWYRCEFTIPEEMQDAEKVYLQFEAVKFVTDVWVDGKKLGNHTGGFERFRFALPEKTGTHTLWVRVEGIGPLCNTPLPWEEFFKTGETSSIGNRLLYPVGSGYRNLGIWEDVTLVPEGKISVDDLFIQTSVRKGNITTDLALRNETVNALEANVTLSVEKLQNERVPEFPTQKITVPADGLANVSWTQPWADALQWNPKHPHLYFMTITVTSPDGKVLAKHRERFGFREFWCDGPDFYLNGVKMHFLATAKHPSSAIDDLTKEKAKEFYATVRGANCNAMRLHANVWPNAWFEAADEVGMPLVLESSLFCYSGAYALGDDAFWKNMETHLQSMLKKHRNNPSVVIVSLCNEILHCGGTRFAADCEQRLARLGVMVKGFDPTRPIMFDGDMDPKLSPDDATGVADIINPHYPMDLAATGKSNIDTNIPESFWWMDQGKVLACYPGVFWKWDRKKPLYFGEFLHLQHFNNAKPYSLLLGDAAFDGPFDEVMAQAKAIAWRMQIEAYRAAGVSGMCPWTLTEPGPYPVSPGGNPNPRYDAVRESYEPITFFVRPIRKQDGSVQLGEKQTLEIDFYNDTFHERELVFEWCSGAEKTKGMWKFTLPPAGHVMKTLEFPLTSEGGHSLTCRLTSPVTKEWKKTFFPSVPLNDAQKKRLANLSVGVVDDENAPWVQALKTQGVKELRVLRSLDEPFPQDCLIVGRNRLKSLFAETTPSVGITSERREKISRFLEQGGIFLVLPQEEYPEGFVPVQLADLDLPMGLFGESLSSTSPKITVHRPFVISQSMESDWTFDNLGGPKGMDYTGAIVRRVGKGILFLSQAIREDSRLPLDCEMLKQKYPQQPKRPLAVVDPTGTMVPVLRRTDFVWEDVTETYRASTFDVSRYAAFFVHADASPKGIPFDKIRVIVHGLTPENQARWQSLVPGGLELVQNRGRVLLPGNHFSLYWLARRESGMSWRKRTPLADDVAPWVLQTIVADPTQADRKQIVKGDALDKIQKIKSFRWYADKGYWFAGTAMSFSHTFHNVEGRQHVLEFDAKGTPLAGVGTQLRVEIGKKNVGMVELANVWDKPVRLAFEADPIDGDLPVTVSFFNDEWDPVTHEDRNLEFRSMTLLPAHSNPHLRAVTTPAAWTFLSGESEEVWKILFDQVNWTNPKAPELAQPTRYLNLLLGQANVIKENPFEKLILLGSRFTSEKPSYSVRQNSMVMGSNGKISQQVLFGAGTYRFTLLASGTSEGGIYPHVTLQLDGKKIGEFQLNIEEGNYSTVAEIPAGEHKISLHFDNDHWNPETKEDRNLKVHQLEIEEK